MNIDTTIIAAIIGLLGIALGSLLSGAGYLYKDRIESIRTIHRSIFYLLKIFHLIQATINIEKGSSLYLKKLESYFSVENADLNNAIVNQLCSNFLSSLIMPIWQQFECDFKTIFYETLIDLSKAKPVTAYGLSKRSYFAYLVQQVNEIISATQTNTPSQQENKNYDSGFQVGIKLSQQHILYEFSSQVEQSIRGISWSSSLLNFFMCRLEIAKIKKKFENEAFEKFITEYIEKNASNLKDFLKG